jgi:predicted dehydrogenase
MPPLQVAVVGTGAFGRNHLRVYRELETAHPDLLQLAALVDPDEQRRSDFAAQYNIPAYATVAELPPTIDAASICVPTVHHAAVAERLLLVGIDILIEKPFAASLTEADHILALATQYNRIVQIGHLERFNPAVTATIAALNKPMFFEAHRLSIFTPRSLDVDVVLDLMIHDLDIVLALANSPVREVRAVGLPILSRKVDIANVRLEFDSGCIANFTASRVSTEQVRKLRLFQPHQYLSLDFARQELLSIDVDPRLVAAFAAGIPIATIAQHLNAASAKASSSPTDNAPTHPTAGFNLTKSSVPKGEPLRLELEDFLQSVRHRTAPRVPGEAGRAALALALNINEEIAAHAQRAGLA